MWVNADKFPGPALWQGIMFCLLLPLVFAMFYRDGHYARRAFAVYAIVGLVLLVVIRITEHTHRGFSVF